MPSDQETTIQLTKSPSRQVSVVPLRNTLEVLLRERPETFLTDCGRVTGYPSIEISRWDLNFRVADDAPGSVIWVYPYHQSGLSGAAGLGSEGRSHPQ